MDQEIIEIANQAYAISRDELESNIIKELQASTITADIVMQFLHKFEIVYTEYQNLKKQKKILKKAKNIIELNKIRTILAEYEKEVYEVFFQFQNAFNEYWGQKIQMVFLYRDQNGTITLYTGDNTLENVDYNQWGKLSYSLKNIANELILQSNEYDSRLLDDTANEVYYRFFKAQTITGKKRYVPILWKDNGEWSGVLVNNRGTISEAYVNFYLNQIPFMGSKEPRVGMYITHPEYGMAAVDNTLGFFKGDIDRGQIQYAAKGEYASLAGMSKVYKYIKEVQTSLSGMDDEYKLSVLAEKLTKDVGNTHQIKQLSNNIEKTYSELISILNIK